MSIKKSTRHQKIIGDFGENLVCNWLSRSGFEVIRADHTGLDVMAYNPQTRERLGISVKSRTRVKGRESASVNLLSRQKGKDDVKVLIDACTAFGCEPWIAVYVECTNYADLYLTSLEHYQQTYRTRDSLKIESWKMTDTHQRQYEVDDKVKHIRIVFDAARWWLTEDASAASDPTVTTRQGHSQSNPEG